VTTFTAQKLLYAIKTLGATESVSLAADNLKFSLSQGQFLAIFELFENPQTTDAQVFAFFKNLTDSSIAADAAAKAFGTARQDSASTVDEKVLAVLKPIVDAPSVTDLTFRSVVKPALADTVAASEQILIEYFNTQILLETVSATDDLDGATTAEDDQEMQFVKVRSDTAVITDSLVRQLNYNRTHADAASAIDLASLAPEKFFSDVGGVSDALLISRSKGLSSSAGATDTFVRQNSFSRPFTETPSANDLPELQLSTTRSDSASVTDSVIVLRTVNQFHSETPSATDAGSLRSQGFADFTYFAEDFVGASRTFT